MKKILKLVQQVCLLLVLVSLQSCCTFRDGDVIETYTLTDEDKSLIPYQQEEIIPFKHSEGYEFNVLTSTQSQLLSTQEYCEDYYQNETYTAVFRSDLPRLDVHLQLQKYSLNDEAFFGISADRFIFFENAETTIPSLEIDGVNFTNLSLFVSSDEDFYISEILYNTSIGIVRINYKNQSYVQIVP